MMLLSGEKKREREREIGNSTIKGSIG